VKFGGITYPAVLPTSGGSFGGTGGALRLRSTMVPESRLESERRSCASRLTVSISSNPSRMLAATPHDSGSRRRARLRSTRPCPHPRVLRLCRMASRTQACSGLGRRSITLQAYGFDSNFFGPLYRSALYQMSRRTAYSTVPIQAYTELTGSPSAGRKTNKSDRYHSGKCVRLVRCGDAELQRASGSNLTLGALV
jgi:hypothetical protein